MKKIFLILHILLLASFYSISQGVGIGTNTPDASAALDISNTSKGLLIPRMNTAAINAISNPAKGLLVFDSTTNQLIINLGTPGTPNWRTVVANGGWTLTGNANTNPASQFIGTTDNKPLRFRVNNLYAGELNPVTGNISLGRGTSLGSQPTVGCIAIGTDALRKNARSYTVAIGDSALFYNGDGAAFPTNSVFNTAVGYKALFRNGLGAYNTALGSLALTENSGGENTALGARSLTTNTEGGANTAVGAMAMEYNTSGSNNTAFGRGSLQSNNTGGGNAAFGNGSMQSNSSGYSNAAFGTLALRLNSNGNSNTAVGNGAMYDNTTGSSNTAVGASALGLNTSSHFNTAVGFAAASSFILGYNNTFIGAHTDANQNGIFNSVALGESAVVTGSNQVRFGNTSTTSIGGFAGYSNISDGRFKRNVHEDVKGIDFVMKLRPVTYQLNISALNKELNVTYSPETTEASKNAIAEKEKIIFSGFIAQEVEQAAKDAGYNFSGIDKPKNDKDFYGLRYSEFVVPLVKAVQEQQTIINELLKKIEKLESSISKK